MSKLRPGHDCLAKIIEFISYLNYHNTFLFGIGPGMRRNFRIDLASNFVHTFFYILMVLFIFHFSVSFLDYFSFLFQCSSNISCWKMSPTKSYTTNVRPTEPSIFISFVATILKLLLTFVEIWITSSSFFPSNLLL